MKRRILASLTIVLLIVSNLPALSLSQVNRAVAQGRGGAVASVDHDATEVGINVLKAGGNAIDAAVATTAALGVTEPFSTGIGGGGFMLIYLKAKNQLITLDGREEAPVAANLNITNYHGYKIYNMGLPSSGGVTGKEVMNDEYGG